MAVPDKVVEVAGQVPATAQNPLGIQQIALADIARMPISQYLALENKIVNARSQVYYDTIRLDSGTAWTSGQSVRAFSVGREQPWTVANSGVAIQKTNFDTNLIKNGTFEGGTIVIVSGIEVFVALNGRLATADTSGMITNPAPAAKTANTYSASLLLQALMTQTRFTWYDGEKSRENGLGFQFPTRFGFTIQGSDTEENVAQNVSPAGLINVLDFPKILTDRSDFNIHVEPLAASLALPNDVAIRILMITKRLAEV